MKEPKHTAIHCHVCGVEIGKVKGLNVILGALCQDPLCEHQGPASLNDSRDSFAVAAAQDGVPISRIAVSLGVSRQRAYQIIDKWKAGV